MTKQIRFQTLWTSVLATLVAAAAMPGSAAAGSEPFLVKDINSSGTSDPQELTVIGSTLYFSAKGPGGRELWKSDGTAAGTVRVKNINPGAAGSSPYHLTNVNGILYFSAFDSAHGRELWRSDGTSAGTSMVADVVPGPDSSTPSPVTDVDGTLFFFKQNPGVELWTSDGTPGSADFVELLDPLNPDWPAPNNMFAFDHRFWFNADLDANFTNPQWVSDGTAAGTAEVAIVNDHVGLESFNEPVLAGGTYYFAGRDDVHGQELWKSTDGTIAGATFVADTDPRISDDCGCPVSGNPRDLLAGANGQLFFTAGWTGFELEEANVELWRSNGTAAGTKRMKDIASGTDGSYPSQITPFKNGVAFVTDSVEAMLWKSNGKPAGTKEIVLGQGDGYPWNLANVNGTLLFVVSTGFYTMQEHAIWVSDGTSAGSHQVADIHPSGQGSYDLIKVGSGVFFIANDGVHGRELWRYDP